MGQRLVITITDNWNVVAAIYYHWSAYTVCALEEAKKIIDALRDKDWDTDEDMALDLIRFCENNGGGLADESELEYAKQMFPDKEFKVDNISRNDGVIAISPRGIGRLQRYSEGDIQLDFDDECSVVNCVCVLYDDLESINAERVECGYEPLSPDEVPNLSITLTDFGFDEIDNVLKQLEGDFTYCKCLDGYYEISR